LTPHITKVKRPEIDSASATKPQAWRAVGNRLLDSAKLVWPPLAEALHTYRATDPHQRTARQLAELSKQMNHFGGFFVLAGYAVENHLKARIVERAIAAGADIESGEGVFKLFPHKEHELSLLAKWKWADIALTKSERRLLERLSFYVQWAGRYPIPKKPTALDLAFRRDTRSSDLEEIEAFITTLRRR
jgi:hypothetical protein